MHKIKEMLMNELYEYEEKAKKMSDGKISAGDLETLHKLTDTVKNIDKIEMLEDGEYSEAGAWMGDGRIYGTSYARGRGRNAKRDSMGRYSRGGEYEMYSDAAGRYPGRSRTRYSMNDAKDHMIDKLEEMLPLAGSEEERRAIHQCIQKIEKA